MDTGGPELIVERREGDVMLLMINRRRAGNTVSFDVWELFSQALDAAENGTPPRALVLTGDGGHFSSGGDVKTPPARGDGALAKAARLEMGQRIIRRLRALPVPTIAAVEGGAYGVGWSLALACDMMFASDVAKFGAPFVEYGLVPDGGAAWFLTQRLGRQRATEIFLSGRTLDAAEAHAMGLVSRLAPAGTVLERALDFAVAIGSGNRQSVELTMRLLDQAERGTLEDTHALELVYCHVLQGGEEAATARAAFITRAAAARAARDKT